MMLSWITEIVIMVVVVALGELVLHWFPWRLILRRDLGRVASYTTGVLAIVIPLSLLLLLWMGQFAKPDYPLPWEAVRDPADLFRMALIALWAAVLSGGISVAGAYAIDWLANKVTLSDERGELLGIANDRTPDD